MKVIFRKIGLSKAPPNASGLALSHDIAITGSKVKAKLLVFDTAKDMRAFWKGMFGTSLGRYAIGAVNALSITYSERGNGANPTVKEVDRNYYCIMCLAKPHLTMEVVCHESVHAGYAFALRKLRAPWVQDIGDMKEEEVAYPAGLIAAAINRVLHKRKLYSEYYAG